tara:strand:- start:4466 stop:5104 length:639 start_codon:yes stop_codon:yes gene_type:complete
MSRRANMDHMLPQAMRSKPRNHLFLKITKLNNTLDEKGKFIIETFQETPEVYENISDQVVQVSMASLIHLMNKNGFNIHYFNAFEFLNKFKMSEETKHKYIENLKIIRSNKRIEIDNIIGFNSRQYRHIHQPQSSSGCYIATMVYKDYNHPKVMVLRNFRDDFLLNYFIGREFVKFYYKYSPSLVELLKDKRSINNIIKKSLNMIIKLIDKK